MYVGYCQRVARKYVRELLTQVGEFYVSIDVIRSDLISPRLYERKLGLLTEAVNPAGEREPGTANGWRLRISSLNPARKRYSFCGHHCGTVSFQNFTGGQRFNEGYISPH